MGKFFKKRKKKKNKSKGEDVQETGASSARYDCRIEDSWKLLDYPTSRSDSEGDGLEVRAATPYKRFSRETRPQVATMPLEATQYLLPTRTVTVRKCQVEEPWGVTLIENYGKVKELSLIVADLEDDGIFEGAGFSCGDIIVKIQGEVISRWSYDEALLDINESTQLTLTILPNSTQSIKFLFFLELLSTDLQYVWCLNNLNTLHICGVKIRKGCIDLMAISCPHVLHELAVCKCDLEEITAIEGLTRFVNLSRLTLQHNKLTTLNRDVMSVFTQLEELDVGNNNIEYFPLVLLELSELRSISLVFNLVNTIPPEITRLSKLESLLLDNNYLTELPTHLTHQLPSLKILTFASNNLTWNHEMVKDFHHLSLLDFSDNGKRTKVGLDTFSMYNNRATLRKRRKKEKSLLRKALSS